MGLLIPLGILVVWAILAIKEALEPECPSITSEDIFKATGLSPKEKRKYYRNLAYKKIAEQNKNKK